MYSYLKWSFWNPISYNRIYKDIENLKNITFSLLWIDKSLSNAGDIIKTKQKTHPWKQMGY